MHRIVVGAVVVGAAVVGTSRLRRWQLRWGATDDEVATPLPGDELVPDADLTATRAITIAAEPADVWPWIVQLGVDRGGFYSYVAIENLAGCDIHDPGRIVPEWQHLDVGDVVKLHPEVALNVAVVDQERALVLWSGLPGAAAAGAAAPAPYDFTWAFVLEPCADGGTRLVSRERYRYTRSWSGLVVEPLAMASFVMSQKMLRTLRDRAEGRARAPAPSL